MSVALVGTRSVTRRAAERLAAQEEGDRGMKALQVIIVQKANVYSPVTLFFIKVNIS